MEVIYFTAFVGLAIGVGFGIYANRAALKEFADRVNQSKK